MKEFTPQAFESDNEISLKNNNGNIFENDTTGFADFSSDLLPAINLLPENQYEKENKQEDKIILVFCL